MTTQVNNPRRAPRVSTLRATVEKASSLAQSIVLPGVHPPVRAPTLPPVKTALAPFTTTATWQVTNTSRAMLVRSSTYPLWVDYALPDGLKMSVIRDFALNDYSSGASLPRFLTGKVSPPMIYRAGGTMSTPLVFQSPDTTWSNRYMWPLGANEETDSWLLCPPGMIPLVHLALLDSTGTGVKPSAVTATLEFWTGDQPFSAVVEFESADPANNINWLMKAADQSAITSRPGYFRVVSVEYVSATTNPGAAATMNLTVIAGCTTGGNQYWNPVAGATRMLLPLAPPPEFDTTAAPYLATRCAASSALFTNVTSVLNMEGAVKCAKLPVIGTNPFAVTLSSIATVRQSEMRFAAMSKGAYGFSVPDQRCEKFHDCVVSVQEGGTILLNPSGREPVFRLDAFEHASHFFFADLDSASTSTFAVTLNWTVEFQTASSLFPLGISSAPVEEWHQIQRSLLELPYFYENPSHLAALAKWARMLANRVGPALGRVGSAAFQAGIRQARDEILAI